MKVANHSHIDALADAFGEIGWSEGDPPDVAVVDSMRPPMAQKVAEYQREGVPVLVMDLGYVRRDLGYFQLGWNRLGWLPECECPSDRWDELGVELQPWKEGDYVLILGQNPKDGAHQMTEPELWRLYDGWVREIRHHTDRPIVFRPHPHNRNQGLDGVHIDKPTRDGDLEDALAGAHAAVTFNSTAGTDALIAGVPVFCHDSAQYAALGNDDLSCIETPHKPDDRLSHFHRVAYAQWQRSEMVEALEWLL